MRLPLSLLSSPFFLFESVDELIRALGKSLNDDEREHVLWLAEKGLPPVTSISVLSAMLGVNPGFVWSLLHRPVRHYRSFDIPKGRSNRRIDAPKVGLKVVQKWLSVHFQGLYIAPDHVYGFVPGRSHVDAAKRHVNAEWVYSVDIRDFFPTTPRSLVQHSLQSAGFSAGSAELISRLTCLREVLAQGAPTSPVLSNMCFEELDRGLCGVASRYGARLTRYADDIVFSGCGDFPGELSSVVDAIFEGSPWQLASNKRELLTLPHRLKVHGLLVHGPEIRLTKGYRNKIRAFRHLLRTKQVRPDDLRRIKGHVAYSDSVRPEE